MEVVGVATRGGEALASVPEARPDVVLLDIGLPDQSGLNVGKAIVEKYPHIKVIALTALNDARVAQEAIRAGFAGYLTKDTPVSRLVGLIQTVCDGQVVIPQQLMSSVAETKTPQERDAALFAEQLTERERDVLRLLVVGAASRDIAEKLAISPNTVRTHVHSILSKLQVHSRLGAAAFAVRYRVVEVPGERSRG